MEAGLTILEPAGREEQLERWGVPPEHVGRRRDNRGPTPDESGHEVDEVTEHELEALGFLQDGGWTVVDSTRGSQGWTPGARDAGMTSHRGVLHPDEHVDEARLRALVEGELGFTYEDVHGVYRRGRMDASTLELRARIDARLLELSDAGANIAQLGRVLGFSLDNTGHPTALTRALARARKERA